MCIILVCEDHFFADTFTDEYKCDQHQEVHVPLVNFVAITNLTALIRVNTSGSFLILHEGHFKYMKKKKSELRKKKNTQTRLGIQPHGNVTYNCY